MTGLSREDIIDSYDNSMEYTDSLLYEMIVKLKKQNIESFLLFFSDHGVDVFDTYADKDLPRSNSNLTKSMVEIPFILWLSDKYKNNYRKDFVDKFDDLKITQRPYQAHLLINSIIDLARLKGEDSDNKYSIFSDKFVPIQRFINNIDYDKVDGLMIK